MGDFSHRDFKRFLLETDGIEVDESKKSTEEEFSHRKFKQHLIELDEFSVTPKAYSSPEARQHVDRDLNVMSQHLGKASHKVIKTMMDGVKHRKYTPMDISRGLQEGPAGRTHFGELTFIRSLWSKMREKFRKYSKHGKLS